MFFMWAGRLLLFTRGSTHLSSLWVETLISSLNCLRNEEQKKAAPGGTRTHSLRIRSPTRCHCATRAWRLTKSPSIIWSMIIIEEENVIQIVTPSQTLIISNNTQHFSNRIGLFHNGRKVPIGEWSSFFLLSIAKWESFPITILIKISLHSLETNFLILFLFLFFSQFFPDKIPKLNPFPSISMFGIRFFPPISCEHKASECNLLNYGTNSKNFNMYICYYTTHL